MFKNRIYIGPANTANFFQEMEVALRNVGLKADFIPWSTSQHSFYNKTKKTFRLFNNPTFNFLERMYLV